jgi:hypothetical protein
MTPKQKIDAFVAQYNNTHIDEDGYYGAQCWDVSARYAREKYGCPSFPTVTGGAAGLFTNTAGIISQYFDRVANNPNDPNQIPPDGAVIVWGTAWSPPYGHTAIKVSGSGSAMTVFEQNGNNPGGNAYLKTRNYSGVIGWLVPKDKGEVKMIIPDQDNWYFRFNKLMVQIRGRECSREEFRKNFVGVEVFKMVEILSDSSEADAATDFQNWGRTAKTDRWDQQIYTLQDQVRALTTGLQTSNQNLIALQTQLKEMGDRPTTAQYKELQAKIDKANQEIIDGQKAIEKAHAQVVALTAEKAEAEKTGNLFTRWIGDLINKIAGVKE